MRTGLCLSLFAVVQLFAVSMAQEKPAGAISPNRASSTTHITHVTVIDTKNGKEIQDRTVIISGGRISEIRDSNGIEPATGTRVVEGNGKYLIPGLWDMHVHAVFAERRKSMFPAFIANGILGIRDMGTSMPLADIDQLRQQTANGSQLGPRIVAAGPILDGRPNPSRPNFLAITTPEQARETVRRLKSSGSDFIKVYSSLSRDSFLAIADEAKRENIPFSGHVPFSVSALEASDLGQKSLEHAFGIYLVCSSREGELRSEMLRSGVNLSDQTEYGSSWTRRLHLTMSVKLRMYSHILPGTEPGWSRPLPRSCRIPKFLMSA